MATDVQLFNYDLPEHFIAQTPAEPRDSSRLMVMDRVTGEIADRRFADIERELVAGDVLVFNVSKVFRARLVQGGVEMFVLRIRSGEIDALIRPGKKFPVGSTLVYAGTTFTVTFRTDDGVVTLSTGLESEAMFAFCEHYGSVPTPPYVTEEVNEERYQTVYAKSTGSVAAPTAGLHFTPELLDRLRAKGVQIEEVTLHVGLGTFRPMQSDTLEEHTMHSEWVSVTSPVAERINDAKREARRVIAVGTTTARVLEGVASVQNGLTAFEGEVNIFIFPGFKFQVIDGLISNFHLPKSTLLVLVSAFAGRENILSAYESAKQKGYRFFSFGDAMFLR